MKKKEIGVHLSHCKTTCKYGDKKCPAKKKTQKEKVFCKDCHFHTEIYCQKMCLIRKKVSDYVSGQHEVTLDENPYVKNKNGLCKDFKLKLNPVKNPPSAKEQIRPITAGKEYPIRCKPCKRDFVCQQSLTDHLKYNPKHNPPVPKISKGLCDFLYAVLLLLVVLIIMGSVCFMIWFVPLGG